MAADFKTAEKEMQSALDQVEKALKSLGSPPKASSPDVVSDKALKHQAEAKKALAEADKAFASSESELNEIEQMLKDLYKKAEQECAKAVAAATAAYNEGVKKSDGMTSTKPSVVKALQACQKRPEPDVIAAAIKALAGHKAEMEKAHGKDKAVAKQLKLFLTGADKAAKELSVLI
jgi:hypothetical protein